MVIRKRCLLWDYTNTRDTPQSINQLDFAAPSCPFSAVSNWNAWIPPELEGRLPFRPMVRTPAQLAGDEWAWLRDGAFPYDVVHFLNEPERQTPAVTPAEAATLWRAQMVGVLRAAKGKTLVGPACASDDPGAAWLADFMGRLAPPERPDFLGLHWYGADAGAARAYLTRMHEAYGLPVVVSEIACTDGDARRVARFTADMANWMDATDWVVEYGFFGCMRQVADDFVSPAAQLMDEQGRFTPLMRRLVEEQPMETTLEDS